VQTAPGEARSPLFKLSKIADHRASREDVAWYYSALVYGGHEPVNSANFFRRECFDELTAK